MYRKNMQILKVYSILHNDYKKKDIRFAVSLTPSPKSNLARLELILLLGSSLFSEFPLNKFIY